MVLSTNSISSTLVSGEEDQQSLQISNTGSQPLTFSITMEEFDSRISLEDEPGTKPREADRNISGSTFTLDTETYLPGTTVDWIFSVYNASTDSEWLKDIYLTVPLGVTVNSVTDFTGGNAPMTPNPTQGNGITINWHGEGTSGWGVIYGGETATATVNVTISASFAGPMDLAWQIDGDIYGTEPHTLSGNIALSQEQTPAEWLSCLPMSGTVQPGASQTIDVFLSAFNMDEGTYYAVLTIASNDPVNYERSVDVEMVVGTSNHAPTISLPSDLSFDKNSSLVVNFASYVNDPDADPLSLSVSGNQDILVEINGLNVTFTATQNWIGSENLTFTVTDGTAFASDAVMVSVLPVNTPNWQPVIYPNNPATIYSTITIEGIPAQANDVVAAFVGSECRGTAEVFIVSRNTAYATLLINLNQANELVTFKVYSYSQDMIYDVIETLQLTFGDIIGQDQPENINGTALIALDTPEPVLLFSINGVYISWSPVAHADRYKVYSCDRPDGVFDLMAITSEPSWTDPVPALRRFYKVIAEKTVVGR